MNTREMETPYHISIPDKERIQKGVFPVFECFQQIPCNPCAAICPQKAISMENGINSLPKVDYKMCNGCGACMRKCPGLAIFMIDIRQETYEKVSLPYEFSALPKVGDFVDTYDHNGEFLMPMEVLAVEGVGKMTTSVVTIKTPPNMAMKTRNISLRGKQYE